LWFRRSLHDHPQAATWLGLLYETGRGEPKDLTVARQYYAEAAAQGDMYGQVNLGMLVDGRGGPADPVEAFRWNMAAARQGSPDGLNGVGYSYLIGHGVAQDRVRGLSWLQAAAEAGQPNAMHTLGSLYLHGGYVPQSPAIAYRWLALAVRTYTAANERLPAARAALESAGALLTADQRAAIDDNVRDWTPSPARIPTD
jgi:TPR repeat protein